MYGNYIGVQPLEGEHKKSFSGTPAGGVITAPGIRVDFAQANDDTVIFVALHHLKFLQETTERSEMKSQAIASLENALAFLTQGRQGR